MRLQPLPESCEVRRRSVKVAEYESQGVTTYFSSFFLQELANLDSTIVLPTSLHHPKAAIHTLLYPTRGKVNRPPLHWR